MPSPLRESCCHGRDMSSPTASSHNLRVIDIFDDPKPGRLGKAYYISNALSEEFFAKLENLRSEIDIDLSRPTCPRKFFQEWRPVQEEKRQSARVIFLAIDGVLNRTGENTGMRVEPELMSRLRRILMDTGAMIVLSTFWRANDEQMKHVFGQYGICQDLIIGSIPGFGSSDASVAPCEDRSEDIKAWTQSPECPVEVQNYVIIDSRENAASGEDQLSRFIKTESHTGLTDGDVEKTCLILNAAAGKDDPEEKSSSFGFGKTQRHYCDGWVTSALNGHLLKWMEGSHCDTSGLRNHSSSDVSNVVETSGTLASMPWYRFLEYGKDGSMDVHTDGSNTHPLLGVRSVATCLVYLSTCRDGGGATALYRKVRKGKGRRKELELIESVTPRRNSVLIFPHECQHEGLAVREDPKIVLRAELYFQSPNQNI